MAQLKPNEYPEVTCCVCGQQDRACYMDPIRQDMVDRSLCFTCLHFLEHAEEVEKEPRRLIRAVNQNNGKVHCYTIEEERTHYYSPFQGGMVPVPDSFKGYGGQKFRIRFLADGQVVETCNLWHNGEVPAHFLKTMPATAEFLKE